MRARTVKRVGVGVGGGGGGGGVGMGREEEVGCVVRSGRMQVGMHGVCAGVLSGGKGWVWVVWSGGVLQWCVAVVGGCGFKRWV